MFWAVYVLSSGSIQFNVVEFTRSYLNWTPEYLFTLGKIYAYPNLRFLYRENQYSNFMNVIIGLISIPNYDANLGNVKKLSCIKNYRFPINETPKVPHYKIFRILFFV